MDKQHKNDQQQQDQQGQQDQFSQQEDTQQQQEQSQPQAGPNLYEDEMETENPNKWQQDENLDQNQ